MIWIKVANVKWFRRCNMQFERLIRFGLGGFGFGLKGYGCGLGGFYGAGKAPCCPKVL